MPRLFLEKKMKAGIGKALAEWDRKYGALSVRPQVVIHLVEALRSYVKDDECEMLHAPCRKCRYCLATQAISMSGAKE